MNLNKEGRGQAATVLFTLLLLFSFGLCALFTILIGAKVYENIGQRIDENFSDTTVLSYISNKVRQSDETDMVSVETMDGVSVLKLTKSVEGKWYETSIYCKEGKVRELFCARDSGLTLEDGLEILDSEGLTFTMVRENLLQVESEGDGGGQVFIALRSGDGGEHE